MKKNFIIKINDLLLKIEKNLNNLDYNLLLSSMVTKLEKTIDLILDNTKENKNNIRIKKVYYVDFGFNIGSEFRGKHYCVVLKIQGGTATIIPLTSKSKKNMGAVDLGTINKLSKEIKSYALINQIQTISKSRLNTPIINGKLENINLTGKQFRKLKEELKNYLNL